MTETIRNGKQETEWITLSLDEYDSMRRTIDVLSDRDLLEQILRGQEGCNNTRGFEDLARDLGI